MLPYAGNNTFSIALFHIFLFFCFCSTDHATYYMVFFLFLYVLVAIYSKLDIGNAKELNLCKFVADELHDSLSNKLYTKGCLLY